MILVAVDLWVVKLLSPIMGLDGLGRGAELIDVEDAVAFCLASYEELVGLSCLDQHLFLAARRRRLPFPYLLLADLVEPVNFSQNVL